MRTLLYLLEKEFKQIRRDRFLPKIIFAMPVLQLLILPFAANFEMRNINLGIIDNDHSVYSQRLTEKILSSGYFKLSDVSTHYQDGLASIESNESDLLLEIPNGFERELGREGQATVSIAANAINGTKGGLGSSYLSNIIQSFNQELGYGHASMAEGISWSYLFNPHLNYKFNMVPGIMVFLLTLIGGFISALNIVSEKEKGTIEQINVSPLHKSMFLLSKLIPFWIIGFILLTIGCLITWIVYGLTPVGSFGTIYLFAAVYLIAFTGFGLAISSISSTQQQAMFSAFFFIIIFALMSGLFTPISSMPEWAQKLTLFNPVRYFIDVMRMVYLKGSGLNDLLQQFGVICLFAIGFNILAIFGYRKSS
ncbi:ABC-2 type transport system permease protein [Parabacteroides sp. PF5-5]|uniref:ABC transporter permease n=1 Tax=unclassified Parabacteroides TaxID=2649774 RepID=UPI002475352C|nr:MULTISPECIES: ABC transporter permease [unclassified Parabacteroides]MDH6305843.1 ABC-2 type transport system permease protein [Parabacteroides sp. PH5-39]MDH6317343.1 ABC-2 type transport system permease protein [Parabacteroides sp. PF5-13]MDH6320551.1 ABC-2 type transport system permease protein [Parabacteroides sp. PH5-13]MDH6324286.1 ABC-2 type transport system permease protein [Parabacteroides sp. PH5-8]MDH6328483.1 ABC-2 type transport system permease protein [Parabacteroides sp. PH5-